MIDSLSSLMLALKIMLHNYDVYCFADLELPLSFP